MWQHGLCAGLFLAGTIPAAQDASIEPSPFDEVHELELSSEDEVLVEGRGPAQLVEYEIEFDGTLHVWTSSELDLFLRVEDAEDTEMLGEDDDSGGGDTPYLSLAVQEGDALAVLVTGPEGAAGAATLQLVATLETAGTRAAAAAAIEHLHAFERLKAAGELARARELLSSANEVCDAAPGRDYSAELEAVYYAMGGRAYDIGNSQAYLDAASRVHSHRVRILPPDHPLLLIARSNLALARWGMGDLPGAHAMYLAVLESKERTLPADHLEVLGARDALSFALMQKGDHAAARELQESALAGYERQLSADHPDILRTRTNLAISLAQLGERDAAHELYESVLEACERTLPPEDTLRLSAQGNMADVLSERGDYAGARALEEAVMEARERTLPAEHPELLFARERLAHTAMMMGDYHAARALYAEALRRFEACRPVDHPDRLRARSGVASALNFMGDLVGARVHEEALLEAFERLLPADHENILRTRANLSNSMSELGDLQGARALRESLVEAYERIRPADHIDVLHVRGLLASSLEAMGEREEARTLREEVVRGYGRSLRADHPTLLRARGNLSNSMQVAGDLEGAHAQRLAVLEGLEKVLPADHRDVLMARSLVGLSLEDLGEHRAAFEEHRRVLEGCARQLTAGDPDLLQARLTLLLCATRLGELEDQRAQLRELAAGMGARVLGSLALAPRQARQVVASESRRHASLTFLILELGADAELRALVFELTETMRLVVGEAARSLAQHDADPELAPILEQAAALRGQLNDLVAGAARDGGDQGALAAELTQLSLERDRLEGEASRRLAERGVETRSIEVERLCKALGEGQALASFRRTRVYGGDVGEAGERLLASVLRADGALTLLDLGSAPELEELATGWRAALGAPILRGVALDQESEEDAEVRSGQRLRERLLDPILSAAGEDVERLFVCADDLVFLLPLDALPMGGDGAERLGDRLRVVHEVSFARLTAAVGPPRPAPSLLAFGGVDYDAEGAVARSVLAMSAPIEDEPDSAQPEASPEESAGTRGTRSAMPKKFRKLNQSRREVVETADLYEEAFELEPVLVQGEATTKAALFEAAGGKRWVHIATHGWFAPESVRSTEDERLEPQSFTRMGIEERVHSLAPMTLCGLALAGANRGRDALGRVPGILTAEEMCSLDLSQCELAVLSACETNVGIRRAGQGIQSLQAALYAAGARTSITSLWKVDDAATRDLMEAFYTNLWHEGMGKAEALWEAKRAMRDDDEPAMHWAGWVLTGDPD